MDKHCLSVITWLTQNNNYRIILQDGGSSIANLLDFLNLQAWGKGLLDFLGLLFVLNNQGVQETGATDLEFGVAGVLLYFDGTSIGTTGLVQEILNFFDFAGHL